MHEYMRSTLSLQETNCLGSTRRYHYYLFIYLFIYLSIYLSIYQDSSVALIRDRTTAAGVRQCRPSQTEERKLHGVGQEEKVKTRKMKKEQERQKRGHCAYRLSTFAMLAFFFRLLFAYKTNTKNGHKIPPRGRLGGPPGPS